MDYRKFWTTVQVRADQIQPEDTVLLDGSWVEIQTTFHRLTVTEEPGYLYGTATTGEES